MNKFTVDKNILWIVFTVSDVVTNKILSIKMFVNKNIYLSSERQKNAQMYKNSNKI